MVALVDSAKSFKDKSTIHWLMKMTFIDDNNINLLIHNGEGRFTKEDFPMQKQEIDIHGYGT